MFSNEQLLQIRQIFAEESKEALLRHHIHRSLVIYGLPEGESTTQVHSILAHGSIEKEYICIRHRLGNPNLVRNRPLRVDLREGIPMPSLRDLARKLSNDATTRSFYVRLLETPRQRKEGFKKRETRRQAEKTAAPPQESTPAAKPSEVLELSAVSSLDFYIPPVITISSSNNSIVDMLDPAISSSSVTVDKVDPVLPCCANGLNSHPVGSVEFHFKHTEYHCTKGVNEKKEYLQSLPIDLRKSVRTLYYLCTKIWLDIE